MMKRPANLNRIWRLKSISKGCSQHPYYARGAAATAALLTTFGRGPWRAASTPVSLNALLVLALDYVKRAWPHLRRAWLL